MSTASEKISWDQIHEAMVMLERHLELATSHDGTLTAEKRFELEQRLEKLKIRIAQGSANRKAPA